MSQVAATPAMGVGQITALGPILRMAGEQVRDKSYQASPAGRHVASFLRALRWADRSDNTLDSYETTLARLAIEHDDWEDGLAGFCNPAGTEYLREFLDRNWGDSSAATRANRVSAVKSCFAWAVDEGICSFNPAQPIRSPRGRRAQERVAYPQDVLYRLVAAQESLRDQCCLQLLGRFGLRKNELRLLRVGEIDLVRDLITIANGKGGVRSVMPLKPQTLRDDLYLHIQGDGRRPDEYLLYPRTQRARPMDRASVHRWFKRCLEVAGLPMTVKMHELRHTAADHLWRDSRDIMQAKALLRHRSVSTTEAYLHPSRNDLAEALEALDITWGKVG